MGDPKIHASTLYALYRHAKSHIIMDAVQHQEERGAIRKIPTGIEGFDEITKGGIPSARTTVVGGGPGAGKTIFALQTLVNGAHRREPGVFVAFEENSRRIIDNASTFGWDLPTLEREHLFFLDAYFSPTTAIAGEFDLSGVLAGLKAKVDELGARCVVFDGIDVLLTLLNDPVAERRELYRLHEWLAEHELTGVITSKVESEDPLSGQRYSFLQFMADCVVLLEHRFAGRVAVRAVRVLKYRGSSFSANEYPLTITSEGIGVATYGSATLAYPVSTERISSGVERLDTMLGGGYYRGSSVLITGSPGVAKTTLSGAFAEAACERGERTLYISFDESADQIIRNLASVDIRLEAHTQWDLLRLHSVRSEARSAEEHLIEFRRMIREFSPRCVVVDPISALAKAGGHVAAVDASLRLLDFAKSQGITTLCTSLLEGSDALAEESAMEISTIADTWIQLSYVARGGERNRALTIIKSRGMSHSNQVRELVLSGQGITLAEVFTAGGEVLMGTARWEKEAEMRIQSARAEMEAERRRRELELSEVQLRAQMEALQRDLEARRAELQVLEIEREEREQHAAAMHLEIGALRSRDRLNLSSTSEKSDEAEPSAQ